MAFIRRPSPHDREFAHDKITIAEIIEDLAMEVICAGSGGNVQDAARVPPVFGAEGRVRDLELVNRVYRRLKSDLLV